MLYYFLVPLAKDHIVFNVFRYLTFRSFMALISALVISLVIGPWIIEKLRQTQNGGDTIREDTQARHRKKEGPPKMGGLNIVVGDLVSTTRMKKLRDRYVCTRLLL